MELRIARVSDINEVLKLQDKYHVDSINEKDKKDGFVTTAFTKEQLIDLVNKEQGLFIVSIRLVKTMHFSARLSV